MLLPRPMTMIADEISRRLDATCDVESPNHVSAGEIRDWAIEYLAAYDDELARFPKLAGQSHWDLWMRDSRSEDALFIVVIFRSTDVEFFCGTGNATDVKRYLERDFGGNPDELYAEMTTRFAVPIPNVRLDRAATEEWLGRGW